MRALLLLGSALRQAAPHEALAVRPVPGPREEPARQGPQEGQHGYSQAPRACR